MVAIRHTASSESLGWGGRIGLSVFFAFFFAIGLFLTAMVASEAYRNARTFLWPKVECAIVSSGISEVGGENLYQFHITYRYTFDGEKYESEQYAFGGARFSDYGKAQRLVNRYRSESEAVCYVNPSEPSEAILKRQSPLIGLACLFTLIFPAIGAGGLYWVWFGSAKKSKKPSVESISKKAAKLDKAMSSVFGWLLFGAFFLLGGVLSFPFAILPAYRILAARYWKATPCVVVSSTVRSHSSDDGVTYSVDILYEYEVDGKTYKSNRYQFMGGSSSGYNRKAEVVRQHPPGKKISCFVNPKDPGDAVLKRGFTPVMLFGFIPMVFVLIGAGGLVHMIRKPKGAERPRAPWRPARSACQTPVAAVAAGGPTTFEAKGARIAKFVGITVFALIWNGICSFLFSEVLEGWRKGQPSYLITLFAVPFLLVGLGMIAGSVYYFLAMFNPWPRLKLSAGSVPLGGSVAVEWEMKGRSSALSRLRLHLEGQEEARYRRGTSTSTDRETFATIPIADTTNRVEMLMGRGRFTVPADTMHSFSAPNNKIIWKIKVHGDIARWPDINEEFEVAVLPADSGQGDQR